MATQATHQTMRREIEIFNAGCATCRTDTISA